MGSFAGDRRRRVKAEINVTPLVDVVLVLLIIFMVVTPMLSHGREVKLPAVSAATLEQEKPDAIVLSLSAEGGLWLEEERIEPSELTPKLEARLRELPGAEVLIKADATVSVRALRPVLQQLKAVAVTQIGFAVSERGKVP